MREIIFRGKRKDNGEWAYGNLVTGIFKNKTGEDIPYILNVDDAEYYCLEDLADDNGYFEVLPETIGQYTGLKDKNGDMIFEGDIVEGWYFDNEDGYGVVGWDNGAFIVGNRSIEGIFYDNFDGWYFEIVGNVHDNPGLLKGEE